MLIGGPTAKALEIVAYTKQTLAERVMKLSHDPFVRFQRTMEWRRELQVILAGAAQKGNQASRIPMHTQHDLLERIMWLEKWARHFFLYVRMKELASKEPGARAIDRKRTARAEWENEIVPRYSY